MTRLTGVALLLLSSTACIVYDSPDHGGGGGGGGTVVTNAPPWVDDGAAYVTYDSFYNDDVWSFEAWVDDPNGVYDVVSVWADVYDDWAGGVLVESFELFPSEDPSFWYSDWYGSSTYLDPFWGGYSVDLVAYDVYDDFGWITIHVDTY